MNKDNSGFGHLCVLIADDERAVIKILETMLTKLGVGQILVARDGLEASHFLDECSAKINVVICDWNMPHMNGLEVLKKVRKQHPAMAFVMLTGSATHDAVREAKRLNITAFVAKPFSQDEIRKKMDLVARYVDEQQFKAGGAKAAL
jgi:YesN/AraC family two-component response regulator